MVSMMTMVMMVTMVSSVLGVEGEGVDQGLGASVGLTSQLPGSKSDLAANNNEEEKLK